MYEDDRVRSDTLLFVVDAQNDIRWLWFMIFFTYGVFIFLLSNIVFDAGCAVNYSELQMVA